MSRPRLNSGNLNMDMDLSRQYLLAAFLAMEPPDCLISLARKCGGGSVTEDVQSFIWDHCINRNEKCHVPYLKNVLKKLIKEVESTGGTVLDEFYERYTCYMASLKEDAPVNSWTVKHISFLFHDVPSYSGQMQLAVPLRCSLNMLQGDTGCALWPSGLFLSEFILSFPGIFSRKSCFELGSGVGLLGVCLQRVKASKVILTDGDASSLANLKLNLELNKIDNISVPLDKISSDSDMVHCVHLPWESAKEREVQQFKPDIVLGADVIYDPSCLPHLIRVLSTLLNRKRATDHELLGAIQGTSPSLDRSVNSDANGSDDPVNSGEPRIEVATMEFLCQELESGPVAFIASVIRNVDTFNCFLSLSSQANLIVREITKTVRPFTLLPYMDSYARSDVHLFLISHCS